MRDSDATNRMNFNDIDKISKKCFLRKFARVIRRCQSQLTFVIQNQPVLGYFWILISLDILIS